MAKKILTVIEVNESGLSILQGTGLRPSELVTFCHTERITGHVNDHAVLESLVGQLKNAGGRPDPLYVSLPRRVFIVKNMRFPTHDDGELKRMISLQLPAHVPYKEEDVVWDYVLLEQTADGYSRILLMVIGLETLKKYLEMFAACKIYPTVMTISSWGLVGWLKTLIHPQKLSSALCYLVIRLETVFMEICFCDQERFYFSRQVELGAQELENGLAAEFLKQVLLTIDSYGQEKMGPLPQSCLILSRHPAAMALEKILRPDIHLPITVHDPVAELPPDRRAKSFSPESPAASTYTVGLGLLAGDFKKPSNFLPANLKNSMDSRQRMLKRLKFFLLFLVAFVLVVAAISMPVLKKARYLNQLQAQTAAMEPAVLEAQARLRQWEVLRNELSRRIPFAEFFDELYRLTPEGISFNSLRIQPDGELTLQGQSLGGATVNLLQNNLLNSPWLKGVTLQHATKRVTVTGEVTQFLITAMIRKPSAVQDK